MIICADVDGISSQSLQLLEIIKRIDCAIIPVGSRERLGVPIPVEIASKLVHHIDPTKWMMILRHPNINPASKHCFYNTLYETDKLPSDSVYNLNASRFVVVPCEWNARSFKRSGVSVNIHVVPLGIDPETFKSRPIPDRELVIGSGGWLAHGAARKGLSWAVEVFLAAFPTEKDVRLKIKTLPSRHLSIPEDPRIEVDTRFLPASDLAEWYYSIDCYLSGSKGEGWGLMQQEAMACGRPLISVKYGGVAEFFDRRGGWELGFKLKPATERYSGHGNWAIPSRSDAVEALRSIYHDRDQLQPMGVTAANLAHRFTWAGSVDRLTQVLKSYGVMD